MYHELKIEPKYFEPLRRRTKTFEVRKNDREYRVGDVLGFREFGTVQFGSQPIEMYSGRMSRPFKITYILGHDDFPDGIAEGYVIMSLQPCSEEEAER